MFVARHLGSNKKIDKLIVTGPTRNGFFDNR